MSVLVPPLTFALWANYKYKQLGDTVEMNNIFTKFTWMWREKKYLTQYGQCSTFQELDALE